MKEKKWKLRGRQIISARGAKKKKIKEDTQGGRSVQPLLRIERGVVPRVGPHVRAHAAHIHPFPPTPTCVHACGLRRCTRAWLRRPLLQLQRPHVSATTPRPACPPPLHLPLRRGRWAVVGLTCQYVFRQKKNQL